MMEPEKKKRSMAGKKRKRKRKKSAVRKVGIFLGILAGVFLLTGAVAAAGYFWMEARGQTAMKQKQEALPSNMTDVSANDMGAPLQDGQLRYKDKTYEYKQDVMTFLCMGIDKKGEIEASSDLHRGGQADALFLAVLDPEEKRIRVVGINRDTMTELSVYDEQGKYVGKETGQIALQHAYGNGLEESCERTVETVSHLFYGIPIHGYCALNMAVIETINDAVGGVDVIMQNDLNVKGYDSWKAGEEVHLMGKDAYHFLHYRDVTVAESAGERLGRQKQYLQAFVGQAKEAMKEDMTLPLKLYTEVTPYMVTNISAEEAVYLATEALSYSFYSDDIYALEGEVKMGEKFEEFYHDDTALYEMILELFYREI